jgi:hypothetical protein
VHFKKRSQIVSIIIFIFCIIAVSWGIFRSTPSPYIFYQSDKLFHVIAFSVIAFAGKMSMPMLSPFLYWPIIAVISVSMEYVQGVLQFARVSSLEDALANLAGVVVAFLVAKIVAI